MDDRMRQRRRGATGTCFSRGSVRGSWVLRDSALLDCACAVGRLQERDVFAFGWNVRYRNDG